MAKLALPQQDAREAPEAGELLPVEALSREGLLITSEGAFVRALEVTPRNPLVLSGSEQRRLNAGLAEMLNRIPAGQELQFLVESSPIRVEEILAHTQRESERAVIELAATDTAAAGQGAALRRLADAHADSITRSAVEGGAVRYRAYVIVPYVPDLTEPRWDWRAALPHRGNGLPRATLTRTPDAHHRAARESLSLTENIRSDLEAHGFGVQLLSGTEFAQLAYRRLNPTAADSDGSRVRLEELGALDEVADAHEAAQAARELRERIAQSEIDFDDQRFARVDGDLEQTIYVSSTADATYFGWLLEALQTDRPLVCSVHVHALDRLSERTKQKTRHRRLFGVNRGAEAQGKVPDYEAQTQEQEAARLLQSLQGHERSSVFRVSIYQSVRQRGAPPDPAGLAEGVSQAAKAIKAESDAAVQGGNFVQRELWQSTLPFGRDLMRKRFARRYASEHVADTLPLIGTPCGSPTGMPMFVTDPGSTIESLNPWDDAHDNGLMVVNGVQGSGKTLCAVTIAGRLAAYGVHVSVIDRSGHYQFLCQAIPGARHLTIGAGDNEHTINPWDTPDPTHAPPEKIQYLLGLHALLVGDHDAGVDSYGISATERSLLEVAIRGTYTRAGAENRTPLERDLKRELEQRAERETEQGAVELAGQLRNLAERLASFVGQGSHAYLCDRETTVPAHSPLVVFDTSRLGEDLAAAAMFVVMEHVVARVERRRAQRLAAGPDHRLFPGDALITDETWKLMERRATGAYLNDVARRSRHRGLFLLCLTQHLSDLDNDYGRALMRSSTQKLFFRQSADELRYVHDAAGLTDKEIDIISGLQTVKRRYAQAYWINGTRGRARVRLEVDPITYWLGTSEPTYDRPRREQALRDHQGDVWPALDELAAELQHA